MSVSDEKTDAGRKQRLNFQRESQKLSGEGRGAANGCPADGLKSQWASVPVLTQPSPALKDATDSISPDEK